MAIIHARFLAAIVLGIFVAAGSTRLGFLAAEWMFRAPVTYQSVEVLTPKIYKGDMLALRYQLDRQRSCATKIQQYFVDLKSDFIVHRDEVPGGYTSVGAHTTLVKFPLPFDAHPGRYAYRFVMNSDCGLTAFSLVGPDAVFEVLEDKQ
jgi:hypothetical protein